MFDSKLHIDDKEASSGVATLVATNFAVAEKEADRGCGRELRLKNKFWRKLVVAAFDLSRSEKFASHFEELHSGSAQ